MDTQAQREALSKSNWIGPIPDVMPLSEAARLNTFRVMRYITWWEADDGTPLPAGFTRMRIDQQLDSGDYAVTVIEDTDHGDHEFDYELPGETLVLVWHE